MAKETNTLKERLFSALQIAPLKNTSSLLIANIAYQRVCVTRTNATVSKVDTLFNCCILWKT